MKNNFLFALIAINALIYGACSNELVPSPAEGGYLTVGLSLSIEEIPIGRIETVNTDDFVVTIYDDQDTEVLVISRFADIPDSIALNTGTYYATTRSGSQENAAFDSPYYFGKTSNFTITPSSSQFIVINVVQANTQVLFSFSQNVTNEFSEYTGTVTSDLTGDSLFFATGETRTGYFMPGPLSIRVDLEYIDQGGVVLKKKVTANLTNALPKTLYQLNVDAGVQNGQIQINVNDDADSVDIGLNPNILSLLTVSKNAYQQALPGSWILITSDEYDALAGKLQGVIQSGAVDSLYSNTNLTFPGTQFTFVNDIGTIVPESNYLFAFKYSCNSSVPSFEAEVKLSESGVTGSYQRVGNALPAHLEGENFFVLKGNTIRTSSDAHLALYSRSAIGYTLGNPVGRYYYASGNSSSIPTLGGAPGLVLSFQGLSSDNQY